MGLGRFSFLQKQDGLFLSQQSALGFFILLQESENVADQVEIQIPKTKLNEGSGFTATAYFRTRSTMAANTPTAVKYRVDCLTTRTTLQDWTTLTPGESVSVSITPTHNAIQDSNNKRERKQLTVASDPGTSSEQKGVIRWTVENLYGSP